MARLDMVQVASIQTNPYVLSGVQGLIEKVQWSYTDTDTSATVHLLNKNLGIEEVISEDTSFAANVTHYPRVALGSNLTGTAATTAGNGRYAVNNDLVVSGAVMAPSATTGSSYGIAVYFWK